MDYFQYGLASNGLLLSRCAGNHGNDQVAFINYRLPARPAKTAYVNETRKRIIKFVDLHELDLCVVDLLCFIFVLLNSSVYCFLPVF